MNIHVILTIIVTYFISITKVHLRSTTLKRVGRIDVNIRMLLIGIQGRSLYWREQLQTRITSAADVNKYLLP